MGCFFSPSFGTWKRYEVQILLLPTQQKQTWKKKESEKKQVGEIWWHWHLPSLTQNRVFFSCSKRIWLMRRSRMPKKPQDDYSMPLAPRLPALDHPFGKCACSLWPSRWKLKPKKFFFCTPLGCSSSPKFFPGFPKQKHCWFRIWDVFAGWNIYEHLSTLMTHCQPIAQPRCCGRKRFAVL